MTDKTTKVPDSIDQTDEEKTISEFDQFNLDLSDHAQRIEAEDSSPAFSNKYSTASDNSGSKTKMQKARTGLKAVALLTVGAIAGASTIYFSKVQPLEAELTQSNVDFKNAATEALTHGDWIDGKPTREYVESIGVGVKPRDIADGLDSIACEGKTIKVALNGKNGIIYVRSNIPEGVTCEQAGMGLERPVAPDSLAGLALGLELPTAG